MACNAAFKARSKMPAVGQGKAVSSSIGSCLRGHLREILRRRDQKLAEHLTAVDGVPVAEMNFLRADIGRLPDCVYSLFSKERLGKPDGDSDRS